MKELASSRIVKCAVFALACAGMLTVSLVGCGNTAGSGIGSASCDDLQQQFIDLTEQVQGNPSMDLACQSIDLNIRLIDEGCVAEPPGFDLNAFRQQFVDAKEQLGCP